MAPQDQPISVTLLILYARLMCSTIASISRSARYERLSGWFFAAGSSIAGARGIAVIAIVAHVDDVAALHHQIGPGIILVGQIEIAGGWPRRAMQKKNYVRVVELRIPIGDLLPQE